MSILFKVVGRGILIVAFFLTGCDHSPSYLIEDTGFTVYIAGDAGFPDVAVHKTSNNPILLDIPPTLEVEEDWETHGYSCEKQYERCERMFDHCLDIVNKHCEE